MGREVEKGVGLLGRMRVSAHRALDSIFTFFNLFSYFYFEYTIKSEFKIQVHMHKYNKTPACDVSIVLPIISPIICEIISNIQCTHEMFIFKKILF
jgi:hypothetical protein